MTKMLFITLQTSTANMLSFQLTKPPIISSLCAKHTILTISC